MSLIIILIAWNIILLPTIYKKVDDNLIVYAENSEYLDSIQGKTVRIIETKDTPLVDGHMVLGNSSQLGYRTSYFGIVNLGAEFISSFEYTFVEDTNCILMQYNTDYFIIESIKPNIFVLPIEKVGYTYLLNHFSSFFRSKERCDLNKPINLYKFDLVFETYVSSFVYMDNKNTYLFNKNMNELPIYVTRIASDNENSYFHYSHEKMSSSYPYLFLLGKRISPTKVEEMLIIPHQNEFPILLMCPKSEITSQCILPKMQIE